MSERQLFNSDRARFKARSVKRLMTSGANALALELTTTQPALRIVNPITEFPVVTPKSSEVITSIPEEVTNSSTGWVAPKAGVRAREMQSQGLARKDRNLAEFARTGEYTTDVARSSYNAFMRMAITSADGNILNISGATELPQGIDPNSIMERIGRETLGAEVREAARYGRISIMVADVDAIDYAQLFLNFTGATKQVNTEYFPQAKAEVLNRIQDKRAKELLADVERAKGVVEGTVAPYIAALGPEAAQKEYFLWTGKREGKKIEGINPDGDWQDIEELVKAPDLVTRALLAHEISLLKSVPEGMIRVILIGDNEAYVPRCCGSVSETQQEMETSVDLGKETNGTLTSATNISEHLMFKSETFHTRGGGGIGYDNVTCSTCGQAKNEKNECSCSKKH